MTEDQFEALLDLIGAIASERVGEAVHQRRSKYGASMAVDAARAAFNLPPKEPEA
jgi:hypothetical protein